VSGLELLELLPAGNIFADRPGCGGGNSKDEAVRQPEPFYCSRDGARIPLAVARRSETTTVSIRAGRRHLLSRSDGFLVDRVPATRYPLPATRGKRDAPLHPESRYRSRACCATNAQAIGDPGDATPIT
jgi:hypothetical protein